jgi:DNA polymerase-3 subunit alpha
VNKATLESLIQCGAFDTVLEPRGITRARAHAAVDLALERSRSASKDRERGQTSLFALLENRGRAHEGGPSMDAYPQRDPWDLRETLKREKQALGFYVSGHPLDRYGKDLRRFDVTPTVELSAMTQWAKVRVAGVVENYRDRVFKNGGGRVVFFELEDEVGRVDVKVSDKRIEGAAPWLATGEPVLVEGKVSFPMTADDDGDEADAGRKPTILLESVRPLADAVQAETRNVAIRLAAERTRPDHLRGLRELLERSPGSCPVSVIIELEGGAQAVLAVNHGIKVAASDAMLAGLERLFGDNVAELR